MGFLDCRLEREADMVTLSTESVRIRPTPEQAKAIEAAGSERVEVGIRPERLTLGEDAYADWTVRGTVDVVEMLGSEQYVHFSTDGGTLTARVSRDTPLRVEEQVTFSGDARHLHLFNHQTGKTLA
jgi:multiple sugar transport system ATP-binding protein